MAVLKKLFYKGLFWVFVCNKYRRKQLYICLSKTSIFKFLKLSKLSLEESVEQKAFKYFVSVVCIVKNEGSYLREWLEYHKLIGVDHFYVYDNGSTDNTKKILQPYIDVGDITYIYFPGRDRQSEAYLNASRNFGVETKWLAAIDLDEFIVLHEKNNLREFMAEFADCSQVSLRWVIYGSSGHEKQPEGMVLENFRGHEILPSFVPKSIFNPRTVIDAWVHYMWVCGKWVDENGKMFGYGNEVTARKAQINHYVIKSWEEFCERKVARGRAGFHTFGDNLREYFDMFDKNEVYDDLMLPYVEILKEKLER